MNAPFYQFNLFDYNFSLFVAFVIGIGFGFFLERGGLGNAKKLAAQFYLTDLTVFKVTEDNMLSRLPLILKKAYSELGLDVDLRTKLSKMTDAESAPVC